MPIIVFRFVTHKPYSMKKLYVLVFFLLNTLFSFGAGITAPNVKLCTQTYVNIGNIVISETGNVADFGTVGTARTGSYLFITAPVGFEFDPSSGNANAAGGGNVSGVSVVFITSSVIAISYNVDDNTTLRNDVLTISNIRAKALAVGAASQNAVIGSGTTAIVGIANGNTIATFQSAITAISFSPATPKCNNDATYALNGAHTLATGVTLNSASYSGTGVSGSNYIPPATAGNYGVTYSVITNGPSCTFTTTSSIDINAAPIVTLTADETSGSADDDNRICIGDNVLFTGYGAATYRFYKVAATLLSSTSPYNTTSLANGDVIYVEGTALNGCKDNSPNRTFTVNPIPTAPTFNPTNNTFSDVDAGFWLDTLGTPAEEANRSAGSPSYFTGPGIVYQSNRYFFYPNVAGNGTHNITYHFVDPTTFCENTASKSIVVGTGVVAGNIIGINASYCTYDVIDDIYIDFCSYCIFGCTSYLGMQYSLNGGASWTAMPEVAPFGDAQGACGFFGSSTRYHYQINPFSIGAGTVLFRYSYQSTNPFFGGASTYYSASQSTLISGPPNITITNAFNTYNCSDKPDEIITFDAAGASGAAVFSSLTPNFVQYNSGDSKYYIHWDQGTVSETAAARTIKMDFTDAVSGCFRTINKVVQVALKPAVPTFYTGYPRVFCKTDYVDGRVNATAGYTYEWIQNAPGNAPSYVDGFYPTYFPFSYFPRGVMAANEIYYVKTYKYAGCTSNPSAVYNMNVNDPVSVNIGQYATVCSNQSVNLNQLQKFGPSVSQTWSVISSSLLPEVFTPSNTSNSPTYTLNTDDIALGTVTFRVTTSDPDGLGSGCPAVSKDTIVKINKSPVITATTPQSFYCSNNTITLNASIDNTAALPLAWHKGTVAGPNTGIISPSLTSTQFAPDNIEKAGGGLTFFAVSSDPDGVGPCLAVNSSVTLTISPEVVISAGTATTVCGGSDISLSGTCTKFGSIIPLNATWSGGLGSYSPSVTSLNTTYTPTILESNVTTTITYTLLSDDPDGFGASGPCPAASSAVKNTINQAPFVNAGVDATFCSNTNPLISALRSGSATFITWTKSGGGGSIESPTSDLTNYLVHPSDYATGLPISIDFTATTNDPDGSGPCNAFASTVTITLNPHLTINAGTDITVCAGQSMPLNGNVKIGAVDRTVGGVNTWSILSGSGILNPIGASNFTGTYSPSGNALANTGELGNGGTVNLRFTSDDPDNTGPCLAVSDDVKMTINQRARVSAGVDTVYCANDKMEFNGLALTPATTFVTWSGRPSSTFSSPNILNPVYTPLSVLETTGGLYDFATGTKPAKQITFTITGNDPDGVTGPCLAESDDVVISINPKLTVNAGTSYSICGHKLLPSSLQTLINTASVKLGDSTRITSSPLVNAWDIFPGFGNGTVSGADFNTGFNVYYQPSGTLADSGTVVSAGSDEFGDTSIVRLRLSSADPDAAGPCLAAFDTVQIIIYPRPIPHFSGFQTEYCKSTPNVSLSGNLSNSTLTNASFSVLAPSTNTSISTSANYFIFSPSSPTISNSGETFRIEYRHTDDNGCFNRVDTIVRVFPIPQVFFAMDKRCQNDTITFTENATIDQTVFPASSEIYYDWYIDGDSIQNVTPKTLARGPARTSTQYSFANYGTHSVKLVVTTNSGFALNCTNTKDTTKIFGPYPVTDYTWSRPCSIDSVFFVNTTPILPIGFDDTISWNLTSFSGHHAPLSSDLSQTPNYKFDNTGIYNVILTSKTKTYNCIKVKNKEVFVVPTHIVTATNPYGNSFATSLQWAPSSSSDTTYSWTHALPTGKSVINSGRPVWVTNALGNYQIGELSYLNSPCFNFQTLDKPMMVLNKWSNTTNLAGAVVEATTGNGNPWVTLGQIGTGINWYNTPGIVGLIGTSPSNPTAQGFSGELADWDISRIGLSQYANQSNLVRFRITFGSSDVNDLLNQRDGLALDSVWIGNRSKVVLMEHFTNSLSGPAKIANDTINSIQAQRGGDVVTMQYHTSFPGTDNMNLRNPADPSSRVLYYGVTGVPRTNVDGITSYNTYGNVPNAITVKEIDNKSLENSKFTLDISSKKTGLNIDIQTKLVAKEALNDDVVVQIAVLERQATFAQAGGNSANGYKWIVRKMLPDAAGSYLNQDFLIDDSVKITQSWNFKLSDFYDTTNNIEVVAFIQNSTTKEVYQAARTGANGNTSTPILTDIDGVADIEDNLLVYPVPSDDVVNVLFGNDTKAEMEYSLINDIGLNVASGKIDKGVRMISFNTKQFAAGLYYLSISKEDGSKLNRKIIIVH